VLAIGTELGGAFANQFVDKIVSIVNTKFDDLVKRKAQPYSNMATNIAEESFVGDCRLMTYRGQRF